MAEESGLILELGEWILRTACEQAVDWPSDLIVAVNVSSEQLTRGDFVAQLPEPGSGSRGNSATAIIAAIIQLAQALRLDTLAGGIETADHYDTLRALGSDHGQGYHLSKPLDPTAMTAYLAAITRQSRARIGRVAVPV